MVKKPTYEELEQKIKDLEKVAQQLKSAKSEANEWKACYDAAIKASGRLFYNWNLETNEVSMGGDFKKILGYRPKEMDGGLSRWIELIHPDDKEIFSNTINKLMDSKIPPKLKYRIRRKDGEYINVEDEGYFIPGVLGKKTRMVGFVKDITDYRRQEEKIRESEKRYRTILESIKEAYFEVDLKGNLTFFNDAVAENLDFSPDELIGMNYTKYITPDSLEKIYRCFSQIYRSGEPVKKISYKVIRKDGTHGYQELSASLMKDEDGKPIGYRGISRDISELKVAEEERKKLESQLVYAQKMESIGTLAAGIAHNFNNLLMGIQGNASIVLMDVTQDHPHYKHLKNIEKLIQNGSKLTSQLLGYAREGRFEVKPISINQIIKETSDTFGETKKEIRIHRELSEDLYGVNADKGQIEQILFNLYVNATDAMPRGGELFISTKNVTHHEMTGGAYNPKAGSYIRLTVKDNGIGMKKEIMDRIFEPFFTTKGLAKGTGLGLASVYGTVKAHGGYIDVDSKLGKGTVFTIFLPGVEQTCSIEEGFYGDLIEGSGTVLLVDDEEVILEIGPQMMELLGYEVLCAGSGHEAIEAYKEHSNNIDMVLLDMVMPDMSGAETFDRLKELNPELKVLLSSGYSIDDQAKEIMDRGCDAFIQKPFDINELSQAINRVINKK